MHFPKQYEELNSTFVINNPKIGRYFKHYLWMLQYFSGMNN